MSNNNWNTRLTLLQRAKDPNDNQAWDEFAQYYFKFVKHVLSEMGVHANDKDDLTQEVLISLWKSLPKFELDKRKARFRTWMSTVIHHKVVDHYRKVNRRATKLDSFINEKNTDSTMIQPGIEKIIQEEWEAYIVETALERVSPIFSGKAMSVFKMSMENIDSKIIAEKLDLKVNSVNKLKNRVKQRLLTEISILKSEMHLFDD